MSNAALHRFRRLTGRYAPHHADRRPPVPAREKLIVAALLLNIAWLIFAMGGVRLWGQSTAAAITLASLFLLPTYGLSRQPLSQRPVFRLLRCPLFWLGLGLYLFMFISALNPQWIWGLTPSGQEQFDWNPDRIPWLPAALLSTLEGNNPARQMLFYLVPWLSACLVWVGLNSRRALLALLNGLAILGIAFALIAFLQYANDATHILGIFPAVRTGNSGADLFWGTLHNANHAAFFLIAANGIVLGLFLHRWDDYLRHFGKQGGVWLLLFASAIFISFIALMAQARGPIALLVLQWLLFIVVCSFFFTRQFGTKGLLLPVGFFATTILVLLIFIINPNVYERQKLEWEKTFSLTENPEVEARFFMWQIASDMIDDRPWLGHGPGTWRYLHFPYLNDYPDFRSEVVRWKPNPITGKMERRTVTIWFQNAHVDVLEYFVEWGIIGCAFPLAAILILFGQPLLHPSGWTHGLAFIYLSSSLILVGTFFEFHLRIPLVLLTLTLMLTATSRLITLRASRRADP